MTLKAACSVAVNGLSYLILFSLVNHRDLDNSQKDLEEEQLYILPPATLLLWSTESSSCILVSQNKQPISYFCDIYLQWSTDGLNCCCFCSGGPQSSLLHCTETKSPSKNVILGGKRPWGTIEIMGDRNGRTLKKCIHSSGKLIPPFFLTDLMCSLINL